MVVTLVASALGGVGLSQRAAALSLPVLDTASHALDHTLDGTMNILNPSATPSQMTAATPGTRPAQMSSRQPDVVPPAQPVPAPSGSGQLADWEGNLAPLATVASIDTSRRVGSIDVVGRPLSNTSYANDTQWLGARSSLPLQPTRQGWRMFDILWYWWLLGVSLVVASSYLIYRIRNRYVERATVS